MEHGEAIEHPWVTRSIENAQRKVEGRNFDMRKQLLEYDDVANDQRGVIYEQRNELLDEPDIGEVIDNIRGDVINSVISQHIPSQSLVEMWDVAGLEEQLKGEFNTNLPIAQWLDEDKKNYTNKTYVKELLLNLTKPTKIKKKLWVLTCFANLKKQ